MSAIPDDIRNDLAEFFARPQHDPGDDRFDRLARRIFAFQFEHDAPYRAWCERRGRTPESVQHWSAIPAIPSAGFREATLSAGSTESAQAVFRTSGTTQGGGRRGTHYIEDLSLYHDSLLATFSWLVLPDSARTAMLAIVPGPAELPDSSLVHMIDTVMKQYGTSRSGWYATASGGIDDDALDAALLDISATDEPICLLGTSFSFVHWLDRLEDSGRRYRLPAGSRIMDTGGFKGRSRAVGESEMREAYEARFGVPASHCVNEYGMTEMCSQFYDSSLRDSVDGVVRSRRKLGPSWVRTRVVDPDTLQPLPHGSDGILQHFDLANAGSVCAIQTEDRGVMLDRGFAMLGRASGAMPRGCSIAMDDLLNAIGSRRP